MKQVVIASCYYRGKYIRKGLSITMRHGLKIKAGERLNLIANPNYKKKYHSPPYLLIATV